MNVRCILINTPELVKYILQTKFEVKREHMCTQLVLNSPNFRILTSISRKVPWWLIAWSSSSVMGYSMRMVLNGEFSGKCFLEHVWFMALLFDVFSSLLLYFRKIACPMFSQRVLKETMAPVIGKHADLLVEKIEQLRLKYEYFDIVWDVYTNARRIC